MDAGFHAEKTMSTRRHTKLIHEGDYVAEVEVELIDADDGERPEVCPRLSSHPDHRRRLASRVRGTDHLDYDAGPQMVRTADPTELAPARRDPPGDTRTEKVPG